MTDNPFWQYSIAVYQRPAVAAVCLEYQDSDDVDVNMLLCAAWLASIGQVLNGPLLTTLLDESRQWQRHCVKPLRAARRFLKNTSCPQLYEQAKSIELAVEAQQQQQMYQQLQHLVAGPASRSILKQNIRAYLATVINDKSRLQTIAAALYDAISTS